jgi:hypothetical protein
VRFLPEQTGRSAQVDGPRNLRSIGSRDFANLSSSTSRSFDGYRAHPH